MTHTTINPTKSNPLGVQYWCKNCNDTYLDNVRNWITGTKNETLRNSIIVKEIGLFRISDRCNDPAEVESKLKNEILFKGGNSFIKFFWDKHIEHHDEKYIAGYGHNGNPYYKTRHFTVQYFTGTAIGVLTKKPKLQVQSKDESETPATHTTAQNEQPTQKYRSRFSVKNS
jgi:formate-dependent nitrite reductase cytochrome c552 subunit